jgi:hypothetical protein
MNVEQIQRERQRTARMMAPSAGEVAMLTGERNAAPSIEIARMTLKPDDRTAYCCYELAFAMPVRNAYGSMIHAGTLANSHMSMLHKVLNDEHLMKAHSSEENPIYRDWTLGTVVAVELRDGAGVVGVNRSGGWKATRELSKTPRIRAAAAMHKISERVPNILKEHLSGMRKRTVSMELGYDMMASGFLVERPDKLKKKAHRDLLKDHTPADFEANGWGYCPVMLPDESFAPADLLNTYDLDKEAVNEPWDDLTVSLLKGGVNGEVAFRGTGIVRNGAEPTAVMTEMVASHPTSFAQTMEDRDGADAAAWEAFLKIVLENQRKLLTAIS